MAAPHGDAAASLIARLASIPQLETLTQETVDDLLAALERVLTPPTLQSIVQAGISHWGQLPFLVEDDKHEWRGGWVVIADDGTPLTHYCEDIEEEPDETARALFAAEVDRFRDDLARRLLWFLLKGLHRDARRIVFDALDGKYVVLPTPFTRVYHLEDGALAGRLEGRVFASGVLGLLDMTTASTFPFGRCARCGNVYVQARRGRGRKFCSESCKAAGIPSAANRTRYARTYRRRKREKEIAETKRVLRHTPRDRQYAELERQFPHKSRREILYLIRLTHPDARARRARGEEKES